MRAEQAPSHNTVAQDYGVPPDKGNRRRARELDLFCDANEVGQISSSFSSNHHHLPVVV